MSRRGCGASSCAQHGAPQEELAGGSQDGHQEYRQEEQAGENMVNFHGKNTRLRI